jgi:hypothetical protein
MASIRTDMEGAFANFIAGQREQPGACTVTLHQFDYDPGRHMRLEEVYAARPLAHVPPLVLRPGGGTPLLDALGTVLSRARDEHEALPAAKRPHPVVVIITDGLENSSREWDNDRVRELITALTGDGWLFTYLGARQDAFAVARSIGIPAGAVMDWAPTAQGTAGSTSSLSRLLTDTRAAYDAGAEPVAVAAAFSYTTGERAQAMGDDDSV